MLSDLYEDCSTCAWMTPPAPAAGEKALLLLPRECGDTPWVIRGVSDCPACARMSLQPGQAGSGSWLARVRGDEPGRGLPTGCPRTQG